MPPHPAVTRQQARIAAATEIADLPAPVYYQQNQAMRGTSAYGPLRRAITIHVEGAAGTNAGSNQIATQDSGVKAACEDAVKEGFLTHLGSLI